jgi:hypothetical protein
MSTETIGLMSDRSTTHAAALAAAAVLCLAPASAFAQDPASPSMAEILQRLEQLEQRQAAQEQALQARDARIAELEEELARVKGSDTPPSAPQAPAVAIEPTTGAEPMTAPAVVEMAESAGDVDGGIEPVAVTADKKDQLPVFEAPEQWGEFQIGGKGFKLANTRYGDLNFSLWAYARYLNQLGLEDTYTDAFGRTRELDLRNDFQFQKALLFFKGWIADPRLRYMAYIWTSNSSQGLDAQVVVAGNLTYSFNKAFTLGAGISGLPTSRSMEGNSPYWLRVDNRSIADDFFRGSFTSGLFAFGSLGEHWRYQAMWGNNLSQLGVDAGQLGDSLDTVSGALIWTPLAEFNNGFGDFEHSENLAVRFGAHYTHSTEDRQSQPGVDDPENSIIRLSDGTPLFQPNAFDTGGRINEARYQMVSLDAAVKKNGWALEGEYYFRWLDQFVAEGFIPVEDLFDHGFQLQASAMLVPKTWQLYLSGSKIYGEYGNPMDLGLGVNWFPYKSRQFRLNGEALYLDRSPVGNLSVPYIVGGDGVVYYANAELRF